MSFPHLSNPSIRGPERLSNELRVDGAARLGGVPPRERAGDRRTVEAYAELGVSLDWMWGTLDSPGAGRKRVRHVCLVVPGSGRTGMVFLTAPDSTGVLGTEPDQVREISGTLSEACAWIASQRSADVHLLQALPTPDEHCTIDACEGAGFRRLGELIYLAVDLMDRQHLSRLAETATVAPSGIHVRSVKPGKHGFDEDRPHLMAALERSYEHTLDCPELCGMRDTTDVLESHRLAGAFDPDLWFLAFDGDKPVGCGLFTPARGVKSTELVYLGIAPGARGRGLASHLLWRGMRGAIERSSGDLTCAVDARNLPAIRLYGRAGMREVSRRVALVRGTRDPSRATERTSH